MRRTTPSLLFLAASLSISLTVSATAQEFGVYTRVFNLAGSPIEGRAAGKTSPKVIVRSLTLLRAGKAYDTIHAAGEVTIFEPARRRFTIVNGPRRLVAEVTFDEISASLNRAERETRNYIQQLKRKANPNSLSAIGPLEAQLDPGFRDQYDMTASRLTLSGRYFHYRVRCTTTPDTPGMDPVAFQHALKRYLEYTDWTARLNYLLHPRALYPATRLGLNTALRSRGLLPLEGELQAATSADFHLRAEHQFHWKLTGKDRDDIRHWESLLRTGMLKKVSFSDYRRKLIASGK